ncbi:MAG: MarR family transcriptional regulator [Gammaproteobacteria bacterium]|jgi:DNA-binding MarR family transcriptional regulator|nr:MarR family transcriptional regulator [Gammaproteobacteria bacterium]
MTGKRKRGDAIDFGLLPGLLGYQVRQAQIAIFRDFTSSLAEDGMTPTLFGSLVLIEANPGLKQADLARALQLDRSTVVTVIDTLEKRGLVARQRAIDDRRSNAISLTTAGGHLLARLKPRVADHEARLVGDLDADERAILVSMLARIFPERR